MFFLYTGLLALATSIHGQGLPYNPSNILLLPDTDVAYILRPSSNTASQAQLLSFDYSAGYEGPETSFTTVSESLPFFNEDGSVAYSASIGADGTITVIAGDCSQGADSLEVWRFAPDQDELDGTGSWSQADVGKADLGSQESLAGSSYLASTISFSQYANASDEYTKVYSFGGMCPENGNTAATWQKDADYSNLVLRLSRGASNAGAEYDISALENRGPPIAQAGATLTGLQVAYSSSSDDDTRSQVQDFVLMGGHTQAAFVNTSQVAIFSLPQETWSFMPIQQPAGVKTDLALRRRQETSEVTPRSGHTAVLSESGDSVIVFGGWVGNVDTPASPQLAILDMGTGGDWSWRIPEQSGGGLTADTGLYGHGAAILPGNVMMVVGGYNIGRSSSKLLRRGTQAAGDQILFYNVSSSSWMDTYSLPAQTHRPTGPLSRTSAKVGLGTGLGCGAALLASLVIFYFWYNKRLRRAREERQRTLLIHSSDGSLGQLDQPFLNDGGFDGRGGDEAAVGRFWPTGGAAGSYPRPMEMQHTTGTFVNVPSPTRGLRKGAGGRNYQYHAAPRFDEKRISRGTGNIHPIAEHANEDGDEQEARRNPSDELTDAERKLKDLERVLMSNDDPFEDDQPNPLGCHPVSPMAPSAATVMRVPTAASRAPTRTIPRRPLPSESDAPNWTVESGSERAIQGDDNGRVSPTKSSSDDRTSSTLSERSARTTTSDTSITRTMSTRTGALLAAAAAAYRASAVQGGPSPTDERTHTMSTSGGRKSPYYFARTRSSTAGSATAGARGSMHGDADSFTTARSNFADLQNEGEALLGGRPTLDRDDPYQRAVAVQNPPASAAPPAIPPPFGSMQQRRRPGLMGSLRRAINAVSTVGERSFSLTGPAEQYQPDHQQASASSSPTRDGAKQIGSAPRRAVSDGGALLKHKRGRKDWEDDHVFPPYHDDPARDDWGAPPRASIDRHRAAAKEEEEEEGEWDVEGEAGRRDVQVLFTVPKARLRVVNDDMDRASLRSASDGAVSRGNSVKVLRREDSLKTLRAPRAEGERAAPLPSTREVVEDADKAKAA